ncbi:MAG: hypothetical protein WBD24_05190 [Candidatus Omnitrophota bacterium]
MNEENRPEISISESKARETEKVYDSLLQDMKQAAGKSQVEDQVNALINIAVAVIKKLSSEDVSLLLYTSKSSDEDYVFAHSLNVCLVSVRIGVRLKYDRNRLGNLALLALTHAKGDNGFTEEVLKKIEHDKEMDEIVKLADIYDGLTRPPKYRQPMTPYETITSFLDTVNLFEPRLTKILLQEITLYPKGSWVQLNTSEIGKVIKTNRDLPLRPVVEVMTEPKATRDLAENKLIYVTRALTKEEISRLESK